MITIHPGPVCGTITAPSSKSVAQRAIAIACLADGPSQIRVTELCDDTQGAIRAAKALGALVSVTNGTILVTPGGAEAQTIVDCGESGLCLRMFAPIAALSNETRELRGAGSLLARSQTTVQDSLLAMGVQCHTQGGFPPISLTGPLTGQTATLDGSATSQLLTGLLIALPRAPKDSHLTIENLVSKPYIELTLELLSLAGVQIEHNLELSEFSIRGNQHYKPLNIQVEGDWSGAAFWLAAGALAGDITVNGLNLNSKQSDRLVDPIIRQACGQVSVTNNALRVQKSNLQGFVADLTHSPDLFPPLAVLATGVQGRSRLKGIHRLKNKESDRAATIQGELNRIGAKIALDQDFMIIDGGKLKGGAADAHGDHRIAMALGIAGLRSDLPVQIDGHEAVDKSYPGFFDELQKLGAKIS